MKLLLLLIIPFSLSGQCLDLDMVVVADLSSSVSGQESKLQEAIESFSTHINEHVNIGVITFNQSPRVLSDLSSKRLSIDLPNAFGSTDISGAILEAEYLLMNNRDAQKIIVLICDGDPDGSRESRNQDLYMAYQARSKGIILYSVYVKANLNESNARYHMRQLAFDPYMFLEIEDYDQLIEEINNMDFCL